MWCWPTSWRLALFYLVLYVSAALDMREYLRRVRAERYSEILSSEIAPSISMLVPAHNEEASIKESVRALLTLTYPRAGDRGRRRRVDGRDPVRPDFHLRPRPDPSDLRRSDSRPRRCGRSTVRSSTPI